MPSDRPSRRAVLGAAAGAAVTPGVSADRFADVGRFLDGELAQKVAPGYALVASRGCRLLLERYAGHYCGLASRATPVDGRVRHPLYSFTKLVSATVVAMLWQDGALDIDEPVARTATEFAGGGKDGITLRHLLTHSAGIPDVAAGPVRTPAEWRAFWGSICALKAQWEPGSRSAYHGLTGLFVAAEVARQRVGKDWATLCRERLFGPLGASSMTFAAPPDRVRTAITPQPAATPKTHFEAFPLAGHPAGGLFGTARDALKVLQLHLSRGLWKGDRLLTERAIEETHTVQYARQIAAARAAGKPPSFEPWGLGPLLRGTGEPHPALGWFGFQNQQSEGVFGHAGIDTVIGVGDMKSGMAVVFITTDSPKPPDRTVALRNGVTDRVFAAMGG